MLTLFRILELDENSRGVSKNELFCIKTRNCVLKTRNFVFKMMNFAERHD